MDKFLELFLYSGKAVGSIFLVALAGVFLVRRHILTQESLRMLSQLVFFLLLPCLLFTKVAGSLTLEQLKEFWIFPVSCVVYISLGTLIGKIVVKLCRPREELRSGTAAAIAFNNSGYIPIPLLIAVTMIFPAFKNNPAAGDEAVALISIYLLGYTPMLWTIGYNMISGGKFSELTLRKIITPPIIGLAAGAAVALTPWLKHLFISDSGICGPLFNAASTLAQATVPCVLLVLGGKLARGPARGAVSKRTITSVILAKLIIFPILAIFYVIALRKLGVLPASLLAALVLVVEAGSPPANNLVVMANLVNPKIEDGITAIIFWSYLASIITLTFVIIAAMWVFG